MCFLYYPHICLIASLFALLFLYISLPSPHPPTTPPTKVSPDDGHHEYYMRKAQREGQGDAVFNGLAYKPVSVMMPVPEKEDNPYWGWFVSAGPRRAARAPSPPRARDSPRLTTPAEEGLSGRRRPCRDTAAGRKHGLPPVSEEGRLRPRRLFFLPPAPSLASSASSRNPLLNTCRSRTPPAPPGPGEPRPQKAICCLGPR